MKRILSVFLVVLLVCLFGCQTEEESSQPPAKTSESQPPAPEKAAQPEDPFGGNVLTKQLLKEAVAVPDGYLLAKNSLATGGAEKFSIEKYDKAGELLWNKTYPFSFSTDAFPLVCVTPLSDNAFVFSYDLPTFYEDSQAMVVTDTVLAKCDKDGKLLWQYTFKNYTDNIVQSIFQTDSGNIVTIGTARYGSESEEGFGKICLSLFSQDGKLLKSVQYGGSDYEWMDAAEYVSGAGLVILLNSQSKDGTFSASSDGFGVSVLALIDDDLEIKWFKNLGQFLSYNPLLTTKDAIYLLDLENNYYKVDYSGKILFQESIAGEEVSTRLVGDSPHGQVLQIGESLAFYEDLTKNFSINFYAGYASGILMTDEGFVIVSTHITGELPTPLDLSSIWYSSEIVYSGYDQHGRALWKKAHDITPQDWYDYDPEGWRKTVPGGEIELVKDPGEGLKTEKESEENIRKLMEEIARETSLSSPSHEVSLEEVREFVSLTQLRPIENLSNGSEFYSAHDCSTGGRLFVFYCHGRNVEYSANYCFFVKKSLHFKEFDSLKKGESTLEDVEKIDPAAKFNFYNPEAPETNHHVEFLDFRSLSDRQHSAHITKDGTVNIEYRKKGDDFVVHKIYKLEFLTMDLEIFDPAATVNEKDWP